MRTKEEILYVQLIERAFTEKQKKIAASSTISMGSLSVTQQIQLTNSMRKGHIPNSLNVTLATTDGDKPKPYISTEEPISNSPEYSAADAAADLKVEADSDDEFIPESARRSTVSSRATVRAIADSTGAVKTEKEEISSSNAVATTVMDVEMSSLVKEEHNAENVPALPVPIAVTAVAVAVEPSTESSTVIPAADFVSVSGRIMKKQRIDGPIIGGGDSSSSSSLMDKLLGDGGAQLSMSNVMLKRDELRECFDPSGLLCKDSYTTMQYNDAAAREKFAATASPDAGDFKLTSYKEYSLDHFGLPVDTITMNNVVTALRENNKQTLVMKLSIPSEANRWSINIVPNGPLVDTIGEVLFHFNPRAVNKTLGSTLIMNSRVVRWNKNEYKYSAAQYPWTRPLFESEVGFELMIQIYPGGFVVFIDGAFCTYFAHRSDLSFHTTASHATYGASSSPSLKLQVALVDDYNDKPETLEVHKIWWGYRDYKLDSSLVPTGTLNSLLLRPVSEKILHEYRMHCYSCMKIAGLPRVNSCEDTTALEHTVYDMLGKNSFLCVNVMLLMLLTLLLNVACKRVPAFLLGSPYSFCF